MIRSGIEGLMEFGTHKHSLVGNLKNIFAAFAAMLVWTIFITVVLTAIAGVETNEIRAILAAKIYSVAPSASAKSGVLNVFFMACIRAPLWEELYYRWAPLMVAMSLEIILVRGFSRNNQRAREVEYNQDCAHLYGNLKGTGLILPVMIFSSIAFGLAHGGVMNIMYQGVGGFIFAWLMIKGGYWPAVIAHGTWNFMLMFGLPVIFK
ncbi:MAG: CPBP family intramembrane metalloprotease [bacterium]|nr:CPBP family intramembrane metalloprotease [bacterium]